MKILIVRHAEPDYSIDSITEKGRRERELLTSRLIKESISCIYSSPLGRAQDTISPTAKHFGLDIITCPWLREFDIAKIKTDYLEKTSICWDILPEYTVSRTELYSPTEWMNVDFIKESGVLQAYENVTREFNVLLEKHGYRKEGTAFKVINSNHNTIVLACHFGLGALLSSYLMNSSPYTLWQHSILQPTSVTTFVTEERRDGIASFRCMGLGDISHLYSGNEPASFAGRFCECFSDPERHD